MLLVSAQEIKEIISSQCSLRDDIYWHMNDKVYNLPDMGVINQIVSSYQVQFYKPEIADCDNRSLLLASLFVTKGYTIAMVDVLQLLFGEKHPQYRHQMCLTVDTKKNVWMIEPETKSIFRPSELLQIYFIDIRT